MREEIINEVVARTAEIAGEGYEVTQTKVEKNNGVTRRGIVICRVGGVFNPTVYVDDYLQEIEDGTRTVDEVANIVLDICREHEEPEIETKREELGEKEYILGHVVFQIVNAKSNEEKLKSIPYKKFEDLALIYRVRLSTKDGSCASYILNSGVMQNAGITEEELEEAATRNTEADDYEIMTLGGIVSSITGMEQPEESERMLVLTNKSRMYGATVIMLADCLRHVEKRLGGDFYILPSSIHEVIAVPVSIGETEQLKEMVREVNNTQVAPQEVLGYEVYRYYGETGEVRVAA